MKIEDEVILLRARVAEADTLLSIALTSFDETNRYNWTRRARDMLRGERKFEHHDETGRAR